MAACLKMDSKGQFARKFLLSVGRHEARHFRRERLLLRCVAGPSFCWLVVGCVENSQNRTAIVYACGGDGVLGMLDDIVTFCEAYAAANMCQYITCSGRSGWVKALGRYGWNEIGRTCGKEL